MTSLHEVSLLRLVAQRLADPEAGAAADAVRWMTALQAQERPGALTSVALRTVDRSLPDVQAALDAGEVVTSWPMRGTLHLVPAEDLGWMLDLAAPRMLAGAAVRRAQLAVDEAVIRQAREVAEQALRGGRRLARAELLAAWEADGLSTGGGRGYHLLAHLSQTGTLCMGPLRGREQLFVLLDEWVPHPRRPERDEALGEWAERYFRSHGPATVHDLARWTSLLVSEARAGLAVARTRLACVEVDGVEHWMDPATPDRLSAVRSRARGTFLLPGFDELLLGDRDRGAVLDPADADRIVPGGNGVFRPTVVNDGRVVGTWKHVGTGAARRLEATPFTSFAPDVSAALPEAYAALP